MYYQNNFDEMSEEVSQERGMEWNDSSKVALLTRFLGEIFKENRVTSQEFRKFLEAQADEEDAELFSTEEPDDD